MKSLHMVTWGLIIIGALNWLLIGVFSWGIGDISSSNAWMIIVRIIYILVGVSALYEIFTHKQNCKCCDASMGSKSSSMGNMGSANNMNMPPKM